MKKRVWLIEKRKKSGHKSMTKFAKEIGLSPSYYHEIESGVKNPGGKAAYIIADKLNFDMSIFFAELVRLEQNETA